MEKIYHLLIEFKTIYPLGFWLAVLILVLLTMAIIWKFSRKVSEIKTSGDQQILSTSDTTLEAFLTKPESNQKISTVENQELKDKTIVPPYVKLKEKQKEPIVIYRTAAEPAMPVPTIEVIPKNTTKPTEQLPLAKEETAKAKDEIVFVNYDITATPTTDSYPVLLFPKKGTVIRSFRIGNTKRRGFKEESFQRSIEQYFGSDFTILGNARLNTGKETRPFEPDIAIIDNSTSNLRIDIEIDEPYAGLTRQPTHCKGEDINRDIYFIDRGWIVIRFSEYQVHLQEIACLQYIANIIKAAMPKYQMPSQLLDQTTLQVKKLWSVLQAQKWEKENYREQYLNHIFQTVDEQTETAERGFDEQEFREEELVKHTIFGEIHDIKSIAFNLKNKHPRDSRIKFYPGHHIYTIDNIPAPSASTIIAKFFPEFDAYSAASRLNKNHELYGRDVEEIVEIWNKRGKDAANKGTFLHEQIENFYLGEAYIQTEEFHLFENFVNDHQHITPFRTEWRIFDEHHHIAGTVDLVSDRGNGYEIYDWKRSKKVVSNFNGLPIKNNQWQRGIGQLAEIDDTSYNRYCLQQSLYRYILEKNYGLNISNMYLIILYPEYEKYYKVEVPYLKKEVEYILKTL